MKKNEHLPTSLWMWLKKYKFIFFAAFFYLLTTASYMGQGFYNCNDSIYGFGDSTAGPIWKTSLQPEQPILGGFQNNTNYPMGENLYSPVGYTSLIQSTFAFVVSKIVGPVCSYNLYNILGYMTTALVMFAFITYLVRNRWIALLAGYAVAFTPYVQAKVGGHPSYGYGSLLIAALWLTIHLIVHKKNKHALLLALCLGACAYFDPYFILLAITVVVPIIAVWLMTLTASLVQKKMTVKGVTETLKPFVITGLVFILIVSPLVFVRIKDSAQIESSVSGVRGNVFAAAMLCSNKPLDYLLPDPDNVYLKSAFGDSYSSSNIALRNWCGGSESRVSLSLMAIITVLIAGVALVREYAKRKKIRLDKLIAYNPTFVISSVIAIGASAFLLGLPPLTHGVITPSGIILSITEMWRIFAREFLVVNIALIILLAISLRYLDAKIKNKVVKTILYCVLFVGIAASYQLNPPFNPPIFSYSNDVPQIYDRLRDNKNVESLAEYPIDRAGIEYDSIVYYLTMQAVHQKKLFNSTVATSRSAELRYSLRDLDDPQTLAVMRAYGIKYVMVHGVKPDVIQKNLENVEIVDKSDPDRYALTVVRADENNDIVLLKILDGPSADSILTIESGLNLNLKLMHSPVGMEYEIAPRATLKVNPVREEQRVSTTACFDLRSTGTSSMPVKIAVNDKVIETRAINNEYSQVKLNVKTNDTISIENSASTNMTINNLGCRE